MTATVGMMNPDVTIVPLAGTYSAPQAPSIISIYQASGILYASVLQAPTTGSSVPTMIRLFRAPQAIPTPRVIGALNSSAVNTLGLNSSRLGLRRFTLVSAVPVDPYSVRTIVTDPLPLFGAEVIYAATLVDATGVESALGSTYLFKAFATPPSLAPATGISQAALGAQPILGSDIYLDEVTRTAAYGANGDLLTTNGTALLGQDLRIRMLTETGQLALDPDFGLLPFIGEAQSSPVTQAQIVRSDILLALVSEPRVAAILALQVSSIPPMGLGVEYTAMAINQQDPANQNRVWPFYVTG